MDSNHHDEKHANTDMVESVAGNHQAYGDDERHWWQQPGLRSLYILMPFLFLGSTTLGYDGSL
jgi:hypothetical protein